MFSSMYLFKPSPITLLTTSARILLPYIFCNIRSKLFFNDRITVVIGGEVNSGDRPERSAGNNSIINNVSLEWKLNESGNRYIRIFYDKNYRSILEGEITETGIGYVYKRKLNKLKELFIFKKKKKEGK